MSRHQNLNKRKYSLCIWTESSGQVLRLPDIKGAAPFPGSWLSHKTCYIFRGEKPKPKIQMANAETALHAQFLCSFSSQHIAPFLCKSFPLVILCKRWFQQKPTSFPLVTKEQICVMRWPSDPPTPHVTPSQWSSPIKGGGGGGRGAPDGTDLFWSAQHQGGKMTLWIRCAGGHGNWHWFECHRFKFKACEWIFFFSFQFLIIVIEFDLKVFEIFHFRLIE